MSDQTPIPPWQDELGEWLGTFEELWAVPGDLVGVLREQLEFAVAVARADTRPYLATWFEETGEGWRAETQRSGPLGPASVAVDWEFEGVHSKDAFNGLAASGRPVVVRGLSIFGVDEERFTVRRHVDWAGLFAQLGLTLSWRVPMSDGPVDLPDPVEFGSQG